MNNKMKTAYKALKVSDCCDAVMERFKMAIVGFGIVATMLVVVTRSVTAIIVTFAGFALLGIAGILTAVVSIITEMVMRRTGYSEYELERLALA